MSKGKYKRRGTKMKTKFVGLQEFKNTASNNGYTEEIVLSNSILATNKLYVPEIVAIDIKDLSEEEQKLAKEAGSETILQFTISTNAVDRDGDTLAVAGWDLSNFIKNPVVPWAHRYGEPPVARAIATFIEGDKLKSKAAFTPMELYPFGDMVGRMYKQKFLNATSVGFKPTKFAFADGDDRKFGMDFLEQELLEYSAVPIPSNPEALVEARSFGIDTSPMVEWAEKILDGEDSGIFLPKNVVEELRKSADTKGKVTVWMNEGGIVVEAEDSQDDDEEKDLDDLETKDLDDLDVEDKGAITYSSAHKGGTPKSPLDESWKAGQEVKEAEVKDLKVMSAWVNSEEKDKKSSYKLPHHKAKGDHSLVWRGTSAAMGALLGARGGVDIPDNDRKGAYNHLKKHYAEFDKEAPDFKFVEAQILKHLPDDYEWDEEKGELVKLTESLLAKRQEEHKETRLKEIKEELEELGIEFEIGEDVDKGPGPVLLDKEKGIEDDGVLLELDDDSESKSLDSEEDVIEIEGVESLDSLAKEIAKMTKSNTSKLIREATGKLD